MSKCSYVQDATNPMYEVIEGWNSHGMQDKTQVLQFLKDSGPQFACLEGFRLNDVAQRLRAKEYQQGHILKHWDLELDDVYFLCSGSVELIDRRIKKIDLESGEGQSSFTNIEDRITSYTYKPGQCISDPVLNQKVIAKSLLQVAKNNTKILQMKAKEFEHVFKSLLKQI